MFRLTCSILVGSVLTASLAAQNWTEADAGQLWTDAQVTVGTGALATIAGSIDPGEDADLFVVRVDDPATFTCSSVGGATWDSQLWIFDMQGRGISFRDDQGGGVYQSTLTGQFVTAPGHVIIGVSRFDSDPLDDSAQELWLDSPWGAERAPDGPGAANQFTQWSGTTNIAGAYTLTLTGASFAYAADPADEAVAWAWSNVSSPSAEYLPSLNYQHTPTGELVTIQRVGLGRYRVDLGQIPGTGAFHVTAFGTNSNTAVVESWGGIGRTVGYVSTFDASGNHVDSRFNVHYRQGGADSDRAAYCWANDASAASYTPNLNWQWNGNRGDITIDRLGVGVYRVTIPGLSTALSSEGGNVQVSPYAGGSPASPVYAKVSTWSASGADMIVNVRTFDVSGAPSDERFVMSYHQDAAPIPAHVGSGAHLWASNSTAASYTPSTFYSDSNGTVGPHGQETITRVAVGTYDVELPDLAPSNASIAMATAHGSDASYATIQTWVSGTNGGTRVRVRTWSIGGAAVDARFTLLYLTDDAAGTPATSEPFGFGCAGMGLTADSRPVLGDDWLLRGYDYPAQSLLGLMVLGTSNPDVPLVVVGAPGCYAYTDLIVIALVPPGSPLYSVSVPVSPSVVGASLYAQGAALAPALNALGIVSSNGMHGVVGDV
ncbi:MAG: hypothetical protein H6835_17215 [Planctomycetes bacterium]|nr:hypothetical protein [Planctomycetota bacterium]